MTVSAVLIPESHRDLLEKPVYAVLTTLMPDGQPQSTVVWADYDGQHVRVNMTYGRQKEKNIRRDPRVSLVLLDPDNPYRWLEVRGQVTAISEEGGTEHIEALSWKYQGRSYYGDFAPAERRSQETRLLVKITPVKVTIFPPARR
ncbi:MAG: PPOX class F420-dependent oxidoreductase [Chloroflexi bacterium]|nr:PPOX class F420-dependent oxidoreductase [Chloroflexota bacterium]